MGMTIDEAILYMELYKLKLNNSVSDLEKDIEAYDIAIDTMRKYQQIEQIVDDRYGKPTFKFMDAIIKVVEDGKEESK